MGGQVPAGYHAVTPYFTVTDANRLIAFMTDAFDGHVLMADRNDNGRIRHARVRIGDSIVMLNEASDDDAANESQMHLFVDDVDATFARALQHGHTRSWSRTIDLTAIAWLGSVTRVPTPGGLPVRRRSDPGLGRCHAIVAEC